MQNQKLSRKQRRNQNAANNVTLINGGTALRIQNFDLKRIEPLTKSQEQVFANYNRNFNVVLMGCAGTGKSFLSMYLALNDIMDDRNEYKKLVIVRSAQSTRNIGFLPGSEKQKMEVYEAPYRSICSELFGRDDAYEILKQKKIIEFHATSFLRGSTFKDCIILFDEVQNTNFQEAKTVLTRMGENTKIMICGDSKQDDLTSERFKEVSGFHDLIKVLNGMPSVRTVQFQIEDIVRSGFVREFLEAEYDLIGY